MLSQGWAELRSTPLADNHDNEIEIIMGNGFQNEESGSKVKQHIIHLLKEKKVGAARDVRPWREIAHFHATILFVIIS